jgi:glucokinase
MQRITKDKERVNNDVEFMKNSIILGVDIGGSHIISGLVDLQSKDILLGSLQRTPINSLGAADEIIDTWVATLLASLKGYSTPVMVSIAMPGPFDYENGISWIKGLNKYGQLYGINVKEHLIQKLGNHVSDIIFVNDATCFLQGEVTCGAAIGFKKVAGFTLGTGFGSAISINSLVHDGDYWQAPFLDGTCDEYFSTRWFVKKYENLYGGNLKNVKEIIRPKDLADPMLHVFDEFGLNLGIFLVKLFREEQYDCIVLGGNIAQASMYFLPQVKAYLQTNGITTQILISKLGERAALIGAASYAYVNR